MLVALDDGPAPPIKYQCADLSKLYQCVSILARSCDVSSRCRTSVPDDVVQANPYMVKSATSEPLMVLPQNICDILYDRGLVETCFFIHSMIFAI